MVIGGAGVFADIDYRSRTNIVKGPCGIDAVPALCLGDELDAQWGGAVDDVQQAVDIRMGAGAVFRVGGVLGEDLEGVGRGFAVEQAETLLKILIDGERTLLAGLIFDRRDDLIGQADQVYAGKSFD